MFNVLLTDCSPEVELKISRRGLAFIACLLLGKKLPVDEAEILAGLKKNTLAIALREDKKLPFWVMLKLFFVGIVF